MHRALTDPKFLLELEDGRLAVRPSQSKWYERAPGAAIKKLGNWKDGTSSPEENAEQTTKQRLLLWNINQQEFEALCILVEKVGPKPTAKIQALREHLKGVIDNQAIATCPCTFIVSMGKHVATTLAPWLDEQGLACGNLSKERPTGDYYLVLHGDTPNKERTRVTKRLEEAAALGGRKPICLIGFLCVCGTSLNL